MHVTAVGEATRFRGLIEFRKIETQRVAVEIPEPEFADAGCVDEIGAVAEVVKSRCRRGVSPRSAAVQALCRELEIGIERVENRRLPHPAVTDERRSPSLHF